MCRLGDGVVYLASWQLILTLNKMFKPSLLLTSLLLMTSHAIAQGGFDVEPAGAWGWSNG
jgi:hypothetical protein